MTVTVSRPSQHMNAAPYVCSVPGCGKSYNWRGSLGHHLASRAHAENVARVEAAAKAAADRGGGAAGAGSSATADGGPSADGVVRAGRAMQAEAPAGSGHVGAMDDSGGDRDDVVVLPACLEGTAFDEAESTSAAWRPYGP